MSENSPTLPFSGGRVNSEHKAMIEKKLLALVRTGTMAYLIYTNLLVSLLTESVFLIQHFDSQKSIPFYESEGKSCVGGNGAKKKKGTWATIAVLHECRHSAMVNIGLAGRRRFTRAKTPLAGFLSRAIRGPYSSRTCSRMRIGGTQSEAIAISPISSSFLLLLSIV